MIVAFSIQKEVSSWHSLYRRNSHHGILYTEGSPIVAFSIQKEVPSWHSLYRRKSHCGILYTEGSPMWKMHCVFDVEYIWLCPSEEKPDFQTPCKQMKQRVLITSNHIYFLPSYFVNYQTRMNWFFLIVSYNLLFK